jgi:hypothetical protein
MGHLLGSGIVLGRRVDAVVDQLFGEELWSGWGVRTMASDDVAFNPLSCHNGTVWPTTLPHRLGPAVNRPLARGTPRRANGLAPDRGRQKLVSQLEDELPT